MRLNEIEHQLTQDEHLCFIRVQKTGSSTLTSIVDSKFHVDRIWSPPPYKPPLWATPKSELEQYDLFRGHFGYDIYRYLPKTPVYMTMLRHPVRRVISLYKFYLRRLDLPDSWMPSKDAPDISLEEFVRSPDPEIRLRASNCQANQLAAGFWEESLEELANLPEDKLLAIAKEHLQTFAFVGLTERFNESVLLLSYIFGWYPDLEYQSLRVASQSSEKSLEPHLMELIAETNQVDLQLYEFAQSLFEAKMAEMLQRLQPYVDAVTLSRDVWDESDPMEVVLDQVKHHYEHRFAALQLPQKQVLDLDMAQPLFGATGWQRRNGPHNGLRGDAEMFRWTGPGTVSTVDLPLDTTSDLMMRLHLVNAIAPDVLESLAVSLNGVSIPLDLLYERGYIHVFQGKLPRSVLQSSDKPFSRLALEVSRTVSPAELGQDKQDARSVGVAVRSIRFFPPGREPKLKDQMSFAFSNDDPFWVEVADFLARSLNPGEVVAAPAEFNQKFPEHFCSYLSSFYTKPDLSWVVIHCGLMDEIHFTSLQWAVRSLHVVQANSVFVVLSRRRNVPAVSPLDKDVIAFKLRFWFLDLERRKILSKTQRATFFNLAQSSYRRVRNLIGQ